MKKRLSKTNPLPAGVKKHLSGYYEWYLLAFFMFIGLLFRLSVTLWDALLFPDSTQYMYLAGEIRNGAIFSKSYDLFEGFLKSRRLPLFYSLMLAPFANSSLSLEHAGMAISLTMSMLTFIPMYLAARFIFSRRAALAASAILSFHTFTLWYSSPVLTEATFTAIYMTVIAVSTLALARPSRKLFVFSGALSALLFLTRDVGFTAIWVIAAGAFFKLKFLNRMSWRRVAGLLGLLMLSFFVVSGPYFAHVRIRTGHWNISAQKANKNVIRDIQLYGGDRHDRDLLPENRTETKLLGDEAAENPLELAPIALSLMKKLIKNMLSYGKSLFTKWGPFPTVFILIGFVAQIRRSIREKNWEQLFKVFWVFVWIMQLAALYALVTAYMRDDRYMYPLMIPGIMFAAQGIVVISDWLGKERPNPEKEESVKTAVSTVLFFLLAACAYLVVLPYFLNPLDVKTLRGIYNSYPNLFNLFPFIGAAIVFFMAISPLAYFIPRSFSQRGFSPAAIVAAAFAAAVSGVFIINQWGGEGLIRSMKNAGQFFFSVDIPGVFICSVGLFLIYRAFSQNKSFDKYAHALFPIIFVATVFAVQIPDYIYLKNRMSPEKAFLLFSTGNKTAAEEINAMGLIPPGKVIWSRKPFMPYYLDGKDYVPEIKEKPDPYTIPQMSELTASHAFDYVVADSNNLCLLRPALVELAFAINRLPGARLIYSRYFPEYRRIISVYEVGKEEVEPGDNQAEYNHLLKATEFMQKNALPFAYRELETATKLDPENSQTWRVKVYILQVYYQCVRQYHYPTMSVAPHVLPMLLSASEKYATSAPEDYEAISNYKNIQGLYREELEIINNKSSVNN